MRNRLIAGVLAGAAMLTVAYAFAQGPGGPGGPGRHGGPGGRGPEMHGPMMKQMISARLDEAMNQANVTPEQRTAIVAARDRAFAAMDANRPDGRIRDQMLSLFEADRLDVAQLQALHAQEEQRHQQVRAAIAQAIVDVHNTLTPAQRKIVADYVRAHRPGPRS